jgi:hypothetical protein
MAAAWCSRALPVAAAVRPLQGFSVWAHDLAHGWVGASPDGLLSHVGGSAPGGQQQRQQQHEAGADAGEAAGQSQPDFDSWMAAPGEGVLEIKCPYKASPGRAGKLAFNEYYMHQV